MARHQIPDLTGVRLGKLVGVSVAGRRGGYVYWLFECDCGDFALLKGSRVVAGWVRHCGNCKKPRPPQAEYEPTRWLCREGADDEFVPLQEKVPEPIRRNLKAEFASRRKEVIANLQPGAEIWIHMSTGTVKASLLELRGDKARVQFVKTRKWVWQSKLALDDKIFQGEVRSE